MKLIADLKAIRKLLDDFEAIEAGSVEVKICAPVHLTITAANGKVLLDTTVNLEV